MNTYRHTARPTVGAGLAAVIIAVSLAGCDRGGSTDSATTPPATGTTQSTSSAPSTTSSSSSSTSSSTSSTSPPKTTASTGTAGQRCLASALRPAVLTTDGAAGSTYLTIGLTNTGSVSCTLRGFPGVSFVGHGNGTQIGAAAQRDTTATSVPVTLAPAHSTTFILRVAQAGNYPTDDCTPVATDGFRIYPPDSSQSVFLATTGLTGCAKQSTNLLTVRPVGVKAG